MIKKTTFILLNPVFWIFIAVNISILLRAYYMVYDPGATVEYELRRGVPIGDFILPTILILVSLICFLVGFETKKFSDVSFNEKTIWSDKYIVSVSFILVTLSTIGIGLFIYNILGSLSVESLLSNVSGKRFVSVSSEASEERLGFGYLRWLGSLSNYSSFILLIHIYESRKRLNTIKLILFTISIGLSVFFPFFNSERSSLIIFFFGILIISYAYKELSFIKMLVGGLIVLLLFTVTTILRAQKDYDIDIASQNPIEKIIVNKNLFGVAKTTHIYNYVNESKKYQYGISFASIIFGPVPKSMWLDKPDLLPGKIIGSEVFDSKVAGVPPGIVAELYWNFDLIGILFGSFVIGYLAKVILSQFKLLNEDLTVNPSSLLYLLFVIFNLSFRLFGGSFAQTFIGIITGLIPCYIIIKILSKTYTSNKIAAKSMYL
ncbi:MAG: oligosaccharide repeat unit polymerase [Cyclobacteriaceae bacterium]